MQKRTVQRGRPAGATTFDAELALAFGAAVRGLRLERGIAQESLAHLAGVERSHMGAYSTRWRTRFQADGGQCSSVMADTVPR